MTRPLTLDGLEAAAKEKLPRHIYNFYAAGSDDQTALESNREAFKQLYIRPRVLRNVSDVDTSTTLFGFRSSLPIGIAPSAMQKLAGGRGEIDVAEAAVATQINLTLSSQSTTALEDVIQALQKTGMSPGSSPPPFWMQLYLYEDAQRSVPLIRRAQAAGYQALVLTVDTPVLGNRLSERETPMVLPHGMSLPNVNNPKVFQGVASKPSINRQLMNTASAAEAKAIREAAGPSMHSSSMTWTETLAFLRSVTNMKIILKGIMTAEDASLSVQHGADGIIVSNHGGRQLNETSSTLEALPEIVRAVQGAIPVLLDGGVRTGSDVFKALALGADFVLIGRPVLWGLVYDGRAGVETTLNILERELSRTMALAGVTRIADIRREYLGMASRDTFGVAKL